MPAVGNNVMAEVSGDKLIITVDLSVEGSASKSGKSIIIGSTQGNKSVETPGGEVTIGLNVYRKSGKES